MEKLARACGARYVRRIDPFDLAGAVDVVREAVDTKGASVVIFDSACVSLQKSKSFASIGDKCTGCKKCIREIGCPALSGIRGRVEIEKSLCMGCGLCLQVCTQGAISLEVRK